MSVTVLPEQNVVGPSAVIDDAASATVAVSVSLQPSVVTVTEYSPAAETVIDGVVAPVDQRYESPPLAVSVVVPPPGQIVRLPEITATGAGFITIVSVTDDEQPLAFVAVSV